MGVRRAMDIVLDTANRVQGQVYTEGPLIHNPQVIDLLKARDVLELDEDTELSAATVVVRAHGITPERRRELRDRGAAIRDATCPHVARVQAIIKKATTRGRDSIIVGDAGHGEVVGIQGHAKDGGFVIQNVEQVHGLPNLDAVSVVAQTTQNRQTYDAICERLRAKYADCEVHDTICDATSDRQAEATELARQVDAMVVVGGRDSANTRRLAQLCEAAGARTYHVETEPELPLDALRDLDVVGVTAGASTPSWLISRVVEQLQSVQGSKRPAALRWIGGGFRFLVHANLYLAAGALALAYANCRLMAVHIPAVPWIAFLYVYSMQTFNMIVERKSESLNDPGRALFLSRHEGIMLSTAVGSMVAGVVGALLFAGMHAFVVLLVACALGSLYRVKLMPQSVRRWLHVKRLVDIPGTRELFITGAWAAATVLIPALATPPFVGPWLFVALAFACAMVFLRTLTLELRDIQGDQLVGKETLPTFLGMGRTTVIGTTAIVVAATVMVLGPRLEWTGSLSYPLLACLGYVGGYLLLYRARLVTSRLMLEGLVDANFLLAGIIAIMWG